MSALASCPAVFLSAPASGQGKTTITAALARLLTRRGKHVRVFKTGPDYLDPQVLAQASKHAVAPIDLWMAGDAWCQQKFYEAAQQADLIIVEGAMGMFDGNPSSADLAARFNIPLVIVMDVKGMAQTAAAIASGLASYRDDVQILGLIANNCGSARHRELIEEALPQQLPLLTTLKRDDALTLPSRHLGLVQAREVSGELEQCFEAGADCLEGAGALAWLENLPTVDFLPNTSNPIPTPSMLNGKTIGIAKDAAFSFIYAANEQLLQDMGANLSYFSPLHDQTLPDVDALWLPGGYPELHAETLAANTALHHALQAFHQANKPILAECGGFLYCLESLTNLEQQTYPMLGLLSGQGSMRGKRGCQGMQTALLPEGAIRGHAHHRSRSVNTPPPITHGQRQRHLAPGEAIYREGSLTASYLHFFFPSNPVAIAQLFKGEHLQAETQSLDHEITQP